MSTNPCPWFAVPAFGLIAFDAVFEHGAVLFVVLCMDVGFVPACKAAEALHDGVIRHGDLSRENLSAVALELATHQTDHFLIVAPAECGTVQRDKRSAAGYKIEHCFGLCIFDAVDVGIQHQTIESTKHVGGQILHAICVLHVDAALFEHVGEFVEAFGGAMMTVVAHKQQPDVCR